jgi:hypothetical protein
LWRRRHGRAHDGRCVVEVIKCEHQAPLRSSLGLIDSSIQYAGS